MNNTIVIDSNGDHITSKEISINGFKVRFVESHLIKKGEAMLVLNHDDFKETKFSNMQSGDNTEIGIRIKKQDKQPNS